MGTPLYPADLTFLQQRGNFKVHLQSVSNTVVRELPLAHPWIKTGFYFLSNWFKLFLNLDYTKLHTTLYFSNCLCLVAMIRNPGQNAVSLCYTSSKCLLPKVIFKTRGLFLSPLHSPHLKNKTKQNQTSHSGRPLSADRKRFNDSLLQRSISRLLPLPPEFQFLNLQPR